MACPDFADSYGKGASLFRPETATQQNLSVFEHRLQATGVLCEGEVAASSRLAGARPRVAS